MVESLEAGVVVVGAGPAGLAAACCLGEAGEDVLMVDEAPLPTCIHSNSNCLFDHFIFWV